MISLSWLYGIKMSFIRNLDIKGYDVCYNQLMKFWYDLNEI